MATIKSFEELDVWKRARLFCAKVYNLTLRPGFFEDFGLRNQIRESSGSIMDNIAEGFERDGTKEFIQFLAYAKASCGECRSQLYRAFDSSYITETELADMKDEAIAISKMISGLMKYLKSSDFKGSKFNEPSVPYFSLNDPQL